MSSLGLSFLLLIDDHRHWIEKVVVLPGATLAPMTLWSAQTRSSLEGAPYQTVKDKWDRPKSLSCAAIAAFDLLVAKTVMQVLTEDWLNFATVGRWPFNCSNLRPNADLPCVQNDCVNEGWRGSGQSRNLLQIRISGARRHFFAGSKVCAEFLAPTHTVGLCRQSQLIGSVSKKK